MSAAAVDQCGPRYVPLRTATYRTYWDIELGPAACSPPTPSPESPWPPGPRAAWPLAIHCHCSPRDGQTGPCQDVLRTSISRQDRGLHTRIAVAQGDVHCSKLPLDYSLAVLILHSQCFWENQNRHQPLQFGICMVKVLKKLVAAPSHRITVSTTGLAWPNY